MQNQQIPFKNSSMSKILTKRLQTQISDYINSTTGMSKPETRCLKDMVMGVLKSKSVFVNRIAASLRESLKLKDVAKRLSAQYLKEDFWGTVTESHLICTSADIKKDAFLLMDGTDISKKHAKFMEGLEFVKNGDTGNIGLGYNLINVTAINGLKEMAPLYSKAYSYEMGTLSSNREIKDAVGTVGAHLQDKGCWVVDRGADNGILKDFFVSLPQDFIIRLKRNTKLCYKGESLKASQIANRVNFETVQKTVKIKKDRQIVKEYLLAAVRITHTVKGMQQALWLVISKDKKHGGQTYLLVKCEKEDAIEVARWAFKGYGLRWKIEEYHRHVKQEYRLEDIQIKTFAGLQSMLSIVVVAMYIVYQKIKSMHLALLLDSGYNYLNKHRVRELTNFIYYKISKVVSNLLIPVQLRWKIQNTHLKAQSAQIKLELN